MTAQVGDTLSFVARRPGADTKPALRRALRDRRRRVARDARRRWPQRVLLLILRRRVLSRQRLTGVYLSAASEAPTDALIAALLRRGFPLALPHVLGNGRMLLRRYHGRVAHRSGLHGLRCPRDRLIRVPLRRCGLLLMPLLGFDDDGYRLGAGGGYYDRLLDRRRHWRRPLRLGLAFACQHQHHLPAEPWDIRLHAVCTERGLQFFPHRSAATGIWPTG